MNKEDRIEVELNQEEIQTIIDCYEKDLKYIKQLEQENKELHNKIDKVIEYIKTSSLEVNTKDYGMLTVCNSDDLLEILKDSDVDE